MRLDHLLSKEHISIAPRVVGDGKRGGRDHFGFIRNPVDAHGWNADNHPSRVLPASSAGGGRGYIDTLLGPEGTRECFSLGNKTTGLDFSHTAVR